MASLPLALPQDVVVKHTFVALQSDFACEEPRAASCPPRLRFAPSASTGSEPAPTTLLIQHLPLRSRAVQLFAHLDSHGFAGKYDYVHLPVDPRTRLVKGFAFVNFPDPADARRCLACIASTQLAESRSVRKLAACVALQQGVAANLAAVQRCSKKVRRKDAELPWVLVDGEMQPIQETARALVLK